MLLCIVPDVTLYSAQRVALAEKLVMPESKFDDLFKFMIPIISKEVAKEVGNPYSVQLLVHKGISKLVRPVLVHRVCEKILVYASDQQINNMLRSDADLSLMRTAAQLLVKDRTEAVLSQIFKVYKEKLIQENKSPIPLPTQVNTSR